MRVALLLIAGCAAAPHPHTTADLVAPANAPWSSAAVITNYHELSYDNSTIGGTTTVGETKIELVVRNGNSGGTVTLWAAGLEGTSDAFGFSSQTNDDVARMTFTLAASPDGTWIALSPDHGASWIAVDPGSLMYCRHFNLRGDPITFWAKLPTPKALALDISKGNHGAESAEPWVVAHAGEPDAVSIVVQTLLATPDNQIAVDETLLAAVKAQLAIARPQLLSALGTATTDHMRIGSLVAELLWTDPATQVALANWIALARGRDAFGMESDWHFSRAVWDLARLVQRDGVTPEAVAAAEMVLANTSTLLPTQEERKQIDAGGTHGRYWRDVRSNGAKAAATYAIQILATAEQKPELRADVRAVLEAADFDRNARRAVAMPTRYANPQRDFDAADGETDVDAWFVWALAN